MVSGDSTVWATIRAARDGDSTARSWFADTYVPVVRAYLHARWVGRPQAQEIDDATQEVFVDLLKDGGALERFEAGRRGGFRAYLRGVVRTVALRVETRAARQRQKGVHHPPDLDALPADDETLSRVFDRAWAQAIVREAGHLHEARARRGGEDAIRRRRILRLRFHEGLPIREIAARWAMEPARVHHEYARARAEFLDALHTVVAGHQPGPPAEVRRECEHLLALLG